MSIIVENSSRMALLPQTKTSSSLSPSLLESSPSRSLQAAPLLSSFPVSNSAHSPLFFFFFFFLRLFILSLFLSSMAWMGRELTSNKTQQRKERSTASGRDAQESWVWARGLRASIGHAK